MNRRQAKKLRKRLHEYRALHPGTPIPGLRDGCRRHAEARRKAVGKWSPLVLCDVTVRQWFGGLENLHIRSEPLILDQSLKDIVEIDDFRFLEATYGSTPYKEPPVFWQEWTKATADNKSCWPIAIQCIPYESGPLCRCGHSCDVHRELRQSGNFIKHGRCEIWKTNGADCDCLSFWPKDEPLPDPLPPKVRIPKEWLK